MQSIFLMVGQVGLEPTTISLKGCCSTPELLTHGEFTDEKPWMQENIALAIFKLL